MEQDEYECEDEYRNDEDEKEENVCTDEQEKTFAQSCHTLFFNKIHLAEVQDAVSRMNRIKMLAGELLSLHIHKCLDNDIPLPKFTQTWCRQLYKEVSTLADNKQIHQTTDDPELSITARELELEWEARGCILQKPSRSHLTQMLSQEAQFLKAEIAKNIETHFKKRLLRFVRWTFHTSEERVLSPSQYKQLKVDMYQIVLDLCRKPTEDYVSPRSYHAWIDQYREFFNLNNHSRTNPEQLIPCMRLINKAFEGSGLHTYSLLPLKRKFRPGFVQLDMTTCTEVLTGVTTTSLKTENSSASL